MNFIENFNNIINNKELKQSFVSCAHLKQTRIFGFITTNIRSISSFIKYIKELTPIYKDFEDKKNLVGWKEYCQDHLEGDKQKYKRLEEAKIIFRNVENNSYLNNNAKIFYKMLEEENENILTLFLSFYLLTGKYYNIDKQPIIEIEKIINSYSGNILEDALDCLISGNYNKLFFSTLFYNRTNDLFYDMAYYLIENSRENLVEELDFLDNYSKMPNNILTSNNKISKKSHAGSIEYFKYDIFLTINYYIFKNICEKKYDLFQSNKISATREIFNEYINEFFNLELNKFINVEVEKKEILKNIFYTYKDLLYDVFYSALKLSEEEIIEITSKKRKQNIKFESMEKYNYKCFMHCCHCDEELHNKMYFMNKKGKTYLEGHHIIQIENSKLFRNSLDIIENVIPLCPNCHRKIHNAEDNEVAKMLKIIYNNLDKKALIKHGIFVDLNTLSSFYGLKDIE